MVATLVGGSWVLESELGSCMGLVAAAQCGIFLDWWFLSPGLTSDSSSFRPQGLLHQACDSRPPFTLKNCINYSKKIYTHGLTIDIDLNETK